MIDALRKTDTARLLGYAALSVVIMVPLALGIYWPAGNGLDVTGHQIGRDFINNWVGPQLAFNGQILTLFDLDAYHAALGRLFGQPLPFHNWGYPLFTLPVFWPLALLPYYWALAVWTGGLFAIFAAVTLSQVDRAQRLYALIALLVAPACLINMAGGQNGFLTASLFIGGILVIERRPVLAGVLFGLLTFKPHFGLVLPFALVALRAWRVIAVAALTAIVLVAATLPLFGLEPWRLYLEVTGGYQALVLERFQGFYPLMMVSVFAGARTLGLSQPAAMALQIAVSIPVLVIACWAVRRTTDPCLRVMVLLCATALVSPYAFNYDLTGLAAGVIWLLTGRLYWRGNLSLVYLLAWIAPIAAMYLNMAGLGVVPLALIALFGASVLEAATGIHTTDEVGVPKRPARPYDGARGNLPAAV